MKRIIAILLALLMVLAMFAGCSNDAKTDDSASTSSSASSDTKTEDKKEETKKEDKKEEEKKEETSDLPEGKVLITTDEGTYTLNTTVFPVTDEPSTFSIVMATNLLSFDESVWMNSISEATNVYPEFICIPKSAKDERKALIYASGEYPDVMGSNMVSKADVTKYGPQGVLLNVKELLKTYATTLNDFLTPEVWLQLEEYDGNIYFLPTFYGNYGESHDANGYYFFSQPKTWLENLGLEEAVTVDDFYNNLIAIRDNDANGNGDPNDEVPLAISSTSGKPIKVLPGIACWFGRPGTYYVDDNGTVVDGRLYDEHKEMVKFMRKLYAENLLDTEIFSLDIATFRAKGNTETPVYGYLFGYLPSYFTNETLAETVYDVMPLLEDQDGNKSYIYKNKEPTAILYQWAITSACQCPEIVVRYCDYLYQPEISMQSNEGMIGIRFGYAENGKLIRYNDLDHADKIPEGYDSFSAYTADDREQQIPRLYGPLVKDYLANEIGYTVEPSIIEKYVSRALEEWDEYAVQEIPPVIQTPEESDTVSIYTTDLDKLYNETVTGWIIGNGDVDAEWDAFVEQMYAFGAQEVIDIKQVQVDRYFAALGQ